MSLLLYNAISEYTILEITVLSNNFIIDCIRGRIPDETDQRVSRVYLTEKGWSMHHELKGTMEIMEKTCFENFTAEEKMLFRRLLLQMYENLMKADFRPEES
jgi:hypothetical protein